jgi:hypothetical protein
VVGDGESIVRTVQVRFDIVWRTAAGASTQLATVMHTFNPPTGSNPYSVVPFETDLTGMAAPAAPGDALVLRFTTVGGDTGASYTPNGDGALAGGSDPNLTLP